MTKKDIAKLVADEIGIRQNDAKAAVDLTIEQICRIICEHGRIELRNFGVFEVRQRAARKARNPRTNTPVHVPPRRVVTFQPGKLLALAVATQSPLPSFPAD